jgi:hypothetical protein
MAIKPTYHIQDEGDEFQVAMYLGEVQVAGACVPMLIGEDEALTLARNLGEAWLQSAGVASS